ncbi:MAG: stage II sporulation protein M [Solirubrobacterales bacterium]
MATNEPDAKQANANQELFDATMRETRETLAEWGEEPSRIIGKWALLSFVIASAMLVGVYVVSTIATPQFTTAIPNILGEPHLRDVVRVFFRNMLVLALHAFVCVAGFMAMRALPEQVKYKSGIDRWVHEHASPFAMVFVSAATAFSIVTQIWILGHGVADIAYTLRLSNWELMLTVLPHALLELTAVFLPLAAFLLASRSHDWHKLLAATIVTVSVAVPTIIVAAFMEAYLWPVTLQNLLF